MTPVELQATLEDLLNYDWDGVGYQIMDIYRKNKRAQVTALSLQKNKLECEKQAKLQTKVLETAKKQNLTALKYEDDAMTRRKLCSRFLRSLKIVFSCHHQYNDLIDDDLKIHSLPKDQQQENRALYIMLNAFVQGHWKNVLANSSLVDKGDKSLKEIRMMCMNLTETQKNHYHIKLIHCRYNQMKWQLVTLGASIPKRRMLKRLVFTTTTICWWILSLVPFKSIQTQSIKYMLSVIRHNVIRKFQYPLLQ